MEIKQICVLIDIKGLAPRVFNQGVRDLVPKPKIWLILQKACEQDKDSGPRVESASLLTFPYKEEQSLLLSLQA
jgi:hypothetical protein